jgi:hypothetical protein
MSRGVEVTLPQGWREVRPGLYERVDTPRGGEITRESVEDLVRASGGSPAFRELIERARRKSLEAQQGE